MCGEPAWPSGKALVRRGTPVRIRFGSPFSLKAVVCGHCLVTLSLTINETLKWLSSLPILMQESFWWWQCSDECIISLFPHLHTPFPPSLISHMVSVEDKHHVYLFTLASVSSDEACDVSSILDVWLSRLTVAAVLVYRPKRSELEFSECAWSHYLAGLVCPDFHGVEGLLCPSPIASQFHCVPVPLCPRPTVS